MYFIEEVPFGKQSMFRVGNQRGDLLQLLPFAGANINKLSFSDKIVVEGPSTIEEFHQNAAAFEGAQLCPFPGRISGGFYRFDNEFYHLPANETGGKNAIHGLVYDKLFQMVDSRIHPDSAWISLGYRFEETEGFPFSFYIENRFTLEKNSLSIETLIRNTSLSSMPMAHGWHAYFTLGKSVDKLKIKIPAVRKYELNEYMIPSGIMIPFKILEPFGTTELDDCFPVKSPGEEARTILADDEHQLEIWQETGEDAYNYVVIYTPGDRNHIAVEPMTCAPNAFNSGDGLIVLGPEEELRLRTGVVLKKVQ